MRVDVAEAGINSLLQNFQIDKILKQPSPDKEDFSDLEHRGLTKDFVKVRRHWGGNRQMRFSAIRAVCRKICFNFRISTTCSPVTKKRGGGIEDAALAPCFANVVLWV